MFSRLLQVVTVALLAVAMLGANASSDPSVRYGRIGHNMMCVCGCGQVLLDCNHVGCPDSERMIGELRDQIAGPNGSGPAGTAGDSLILNWFVAKYGATVLAAPIRGGFDNIAWILPIAIFLLGTGGTALVVRMWSQRQKPALATAMPSSFADDAIRDRIRRETEWK